MDILSVINTYPEDHILRRIINDRPGPIQEAYLYYLEQALNSIETVSSVAATSFLQHKLRAQSGNSYSIHAFLSTVCEITVLNTLLHKLDNKNLFEYEPTPVPNSKKNPEFSIIIHGQKYYIEVKSPNMELVNKSLISLISKEPSVVQFDSRIIPFSKDLMSDAVTSTDSKVKDFLIDANNKFLHSTDLSHINILFICWTDQTDQPATALKHPAHGLLTANCWLKNPDDSIMQFENIDLIFINDVLQNHIIHLSLLEPLPGILTGTPYFNELIGKPLCLSYIPNPFDLCSSRNAIIEPTIPPELFFELPISSYQEGVTVITEDYVRKYCPEIKLHVRDDV